jgi:heme exporter protein C
MKPKSIWHNILDAVTLVMFLIAVGLVFFYAPMEQTMGQVQRVFYFHVATAWVGMLGFLVAAIVGVIFLINKEPVLDIVGQAAIEISLVFFFIAIVSGSIWARPTWGTWWTWDVRLTTATIVELVYAAYLLLRAGIEDPDRRARIGAVYAILGFVSVPLTFISIRLLRTIHPVLFGNSGGSTESGLGDPRMLFTFIFSLITFSFIFGDLLWHRIRLGRLAEKVEQLRLKMGH